MKLRVNKKRFLETIDKAEEEDILSRRFDIFITVVILINTTAIIIETVKPIYDRYQLVFDTLEIISVIIFTLEYVARVWLCTIKEKYQHPVWGRLRYMASGEAIIDLLAILPFYLPMVMVFNPTILRILRLFRLLRLLKLGRYSLSFKLIKNVITDRKDELLVTLTFLALLLVFSSSIMYYIEHEAQPETFPSIPATMWWGVATLTTVGYGDVYPITPLGKLLGAFIAILGIGVFALPAGIIATGFESELSKKKKNKKEKQPEEEA